MAKRRAKQATVKPAGRGKRSSPIPVKLIVALIAVLITAVGGSGWLLLQGGERQALRELAEWLRPTAAASEPARASEPEPAEPAGPRDYEVATVLRVVDGDTLLVRTAEGEERVRLLCINTSESVHPDKAKNEPLGKAASEFTKARLEGAQVRLEPELNGDEKDRYGRRLAYVIVDGMNFNLELVRQGLSAYETKYGKSRRYHDRFVAAEREAREQKLGIWGVPLD